MRVPVVARVRANLSEEESGRGVVGSELLLGKPRGASHRNPHQRSSQDELASEIPTIGITTKPRATRMPPLRSRPASREMTGMAHSVSKLHAVIVAPTLEKDQRVTEA